MSDFNETKFRLIGQREEIAHHMRNISMGSAPAWHLAQVADTMLAVATGLHDLANFPGYPPASASGEPVSPSVAWAICACALLQVDALIAREVDKAQGS